MLLVESGIAYSLVWVTYLFICPIPRLVVNLRIYQAVVLSSQGSGYTPFSYGIQYFTEGCLLALVVSVSFCPHLALPARRRKYANTRLVQGIYPTLIIILVALDKSEIEKQSHAWSLPVVRAEQRSRPRLGREVAIDVTCSGDAGAGGGGLGTQSIVLIDIPSSAQLSDITCEDDPKFRES